MKDWESKQTSSATLPRTHRQLASGRENGRNAWMDGRGYLLLLAILDEELVDGGRFGDVTGRVVM